MWNKCNEKATEIVKNECPYCHEHLLMNKRSFANHVRWCKDNPRYNEIRKNTIEKNSKKNREYYDKKLGRLQTYVVKCEKCGKEFEVREREKQHPLKEKYYCCRSCANSHERTEESKLKTSNSVKKYMRSIGRGVVDDILLEEKICENCGKIFHTRKKSKNFVQYDVEDSIMLD